MTGLENISFRQLQIYLAIVECGNLSRAAHQMSLTPPAISTALKSIEDQLGSATIERNKNGKITVLPAGEELYKLALRIQSALQLTAERIASLEAGYQGRVKIGAVATTKYFAPDIIKKISLAFPDIQIDLVIKNRDEIIQSLDNHSIHFAIMGRPPHQPIVDYTVIGHHHHFLLSAPKFDWDGSWQSLTKRVFFVREEISGTRMLFERFISSSPISNLRRQEFHSNESIKQAVIADLGIAFLSASTCEYELKAGRLKILSLPELPIIRDWYLVWNSNSTLDATSLRIHDYILTNKTSLMPDFQFNS